jgi:hypothetical protein
MDFPRCVSDARGPMMCTIVFADSAITLISAGLMDFMQVDLLRGRKKHTGTEKNEPAKA